MHGGDSEGLFSLLDTNSDEEVSFSSSERSQHSLIFVGTLSRERNLRTRALCKVSLEEFLSFFDTLKRRKGGTVVSVVMAYLEALPPSDRKAHRGTQE